MTFQHYPTLRFSEADALLESDKIIFNVCAQSDITNHQLHFIELVYVVDGCANHIVDDTSELIKKGDYFIMDCEKYHEYNKIDDNDFAIINCLFTPQFIDLTLSNCQRFEEIANNYLINFSFSQLKAPPTNQVFHDKDGHILDMLDALYNEYTKKDIGYLEVMRCRLIILLVDIMRQLQLPITEDNMIENDVIKYITRHVKKHFSENLSLKEIAQKHNYTSAHISKLFKKEIGMNFSDYLQSVRMQESCRLLSNTNKSISEIAFLVGYTDIKFFNKIFKRVIGMTPRQFKNTYNKKI